MTAPTIDCQVINLDGSSERMDAARKDLEAAGIQFRRLSAVDGRGKSAHDFPEYDSARAVGFYGREMTGGEIGCYKSHILAAENFLSSGAAYGLVLEDDVTLPSDAQDILDGALAALDRQPGWYLVNLGRAPHKIYRKGEAFGRYSLCRAFYFPVTTTALLWSREGAESFLATRGHIFAPVDHFFRRWCCEHGRGYALDPAPFISADNGSDIDAAPQVRKRIRRTPGYFWAEFRRQSRNYLNAYRNRAQAK